MPVNNHHKTTSRRKDFKNHLMKLEKIFDQNEERYRLLKEIDQAILKVTDSKSLDAVFELIWSNAINKTGSVGGEIILIKHNSLDVVKVYPSYRWNHPTLVEKSIVSKAILDNENKNIADMKDSGKYLEIKEGYYNSSSPKINSELVVLIKSENSDKTLGVLNFERTKKGEFSEDEVEWAKLLAGEAAIAIRQQQLWEGVQTLNDITLLLATEKISPEKVFQNIISKIVEWTDCEQCYILQKDENEFLVLGSNEKDDYGIRITRESLIGHILTKNNHSDIFYESEFQEAEFKEFFVYTKNRNIQSILIIPLIENNNIVGALYLDDSRKDHFPEFTIELLKVLGGILSKTLAATSRITIESQNELIDKAKYILSQLESVKDNFTHRYGSNIGDSRGKLLELKKILSDIELPNVPHRNISVPDFIDWIVTNLVNQKEELLKFSKQYDTKHIVENTHPMDLLKLTEQFIRSYSKRYPHIEFYFENKIPDGFKGGTYISTFCKLNLLIKDVFDNLVENSVQAIEKSKNAQKGQITFTAKTETSHYIALEIKDNGIGISQNIVPKLFKGYSSKTEPDLHGKGLPFCNLYVWAHGGSIDVISKEGDGAIFKLIFPTVQNPRGNKI